MGFLLSRSNLSYVAIGLTSFAIGVLSAPLANDSIHLSIPEVAISEPDSHHSVEEIQPSELTFQVFGRGCRHQDGSENRASFETFEASDGKPVISSFLYDFGSRKSAVQRFKTELKQSTEIIDRSSDLNYWGRKVGERAVVKKGEEFLLITLADESPEGNSISIVQSPTLRHVLDFEKQRKSQINSSILNRLN